MCSILHNAKALRSVLTQTVHLVLQPRSRDLKGRCRKWNKNANNSLKVDLSGVRVTNYTETRAEWKEKGCRISQLFIFAFCLCNNQVKHHLNTRCSTVRRSKLCPATLARSGRRKVAETYGFLAPANYVEGVERVEGLDWSAWICGQLIWKVPSRGDGLPPCNQPIFNPLNRHSPLCALKTFSSS